MTPTSAPQPLGRRLLPLVLLATLAVALGLLLTSPGNVRAEEPEAEESTLAEYEIEWLQYPEKNTPRNKEGVGSVVWGGGSFLNLIGKLSIEGCNANAVAIRTPTGEMLYHHFQAPDFVNPAFSQGQYTRDVPEGSQVTFTCVDVCDILVGVNQDKWERELGRRRCASWTRNPLLISFALTSDCTEDFPDEVVRHFSNRVPIFQDTCIIYYSRRQSNTVIAGFAPPSIVLSSRAGGDVFFRAFQPMVAVNNDNVVRNGDKRYVRHLKLIMHELCHQQQRWYMYKFYQTYDLASQGQYMQYNETQAYKDLIVAAKYVQDEDGEWYLEEGSPYHNNGYNSPVELAAYVCAGWLTEKIYESDYPDVPEHQRAIPYSYLTPEMREWVQKWMIIG